MAVRNCSPSVKSWNSLAIHGQLSSGRLKMDLWKFAPKPKLKKKKLHLGEINFSNTNENCVLKSIKSQLLNTSDDNKDNSSEKYNQIICLEEPSLIESQNDNEKDYESIPNILNQNFEISKKEILKR